MDPASAAAVEQKYKKLWTQYKLAVTGLYFSDKAPSGGSLFSWQGAGGIRGSEADPILTYLQTPRLNPELQQYLKD